ncbi:hypothetical protein [Microbacterium phage MO526]|uniref:Head-to-tail stopper n=1 Tax=Microbacterium phage MO526 TaxID=3108092 RepID=A0ABZ0ZZ68_9CAUD|nr:hypothetical protein [Microbacterium phage MO526]
MTKLNDLIRGATHSNILGAGAFAESIRQEVADEIEGALIAASGGAEHLVRVRGSAWTLQHPLPERFEEHGNGASLMDCRFTPLVNAAMEQGAMFDGTHRVWIDRGVLQWEEIA